MLNLFKIKYPHLKKATWDPISLQAKTERCLWSFSVQNKTLQLLISPPQPHDVTTKGVKLSNVHNCILRAIASCKRPTVWLYEGQQTFPHNKEFLYESIIMLQNITLTLSQLTLSAHYKPNSVHLTRQNLAPPPPSRKIYTEPQCNQLQNYYQYKES